MVASLGIFGVTAFQVSRRVKELGVRMTLGATRGGIVTLIVREVAAMLTLGAFIRATVTLTLTGLAGKMLLGIAPTEPGVFALALRASRVDPMVALRHD